MKTRFNRNTDFGGIPTLDYDQATQAAEQLLAMDGLGKRADLQTLEAARAFYFFEARLLDEERYDSWYDLLADDLFYWMPLRESRFRKDKRQPLDPRNMAFFDERKADIAVRLGRIASGLVWTEDPATRHVYQVSNIELFETDTPGEYEAHSVFTQYRNRIERDEATLHGRRRDLLRKTADGSFQIARRMILLPQSVLATKNLSVFF